MLIPFLFTWLVAVAQRIATEEKYMNNLGNVTNMMMSTSRV